MKFTTSQIWSSFRSLPNGGMASAAPCLIVLNNAASPVPNFQRSGAVRSAAIATAAERALPSSSWHDWQFCRKNVLPLFTDAGGPGVAGTISYISERAEFTPRNVQTADDRSKLVYRIKVAIDNASGVFKVGKVRLLKLNRDMQDTLTARAARRGTLTDRDVTLERAGKDKPKYTWDWSDSKTKAPKNVELLDVDAYLAETLKTALGKASSDDDEEDDEKPKKNKKQTAPAKKQSSRKRDDDDDDDDEVNIDDFDDDDADFEEFDDDEEDDD